MKTINEHLYLPVPVGSKDFRVELNHVIYDCRKDVFDSRGVTFTELPKGEWELVCLASEMTEEVAKGLVEKNKYGHDGWKTYTEKSGLMYWESSALESFRSLMEANEMDLTKSDYVILKRK